MEKRKKKVVLLLEMEEEMEEKEVEELVGGEGEEWWRMAGQKRARGCFWAAIFVGLLAGKGRRKEIMKEREGKWVWLYKGE